MLTFLSAAIPIVGSLYAAFSYLAEKVEVEHEYRVRRRLRPLRDERFYRLKPVEMARAERMGRAFDMDVFLHMLDEADRVLYEANGVRPPISIRLRDLNSEMSRPRLSGAESRRQWALLISSAIGLVLIAAAGFDAE